MTNHQHLPVRDFQWLAQRVYWVERGNKLEEDKQAKWDDLACQIGSCTYCKRLLSGFAAAATTPATYIGPSPRE